MICDNSSVQSLLIPCLLRVVFKINYRKVIERRVANKKEGIIAHSEDSTLVKRDPSTVVY